MSSYRYIINILIKDDTCSNETIMNTPKSDMLYLFNIYYNIKQQTNNGSLTFVPGVRFLQT